MRGVVRGASIILASTIGLFTNSPTTPAAITAPTVTSSTVLTTAEQNLLTSYSDSQPTSAPVVPTTFQPVVKGHIAPPNIVTAQPHALTSGGNYTVGNPLYWTWRTDPTAYEPTADDPIHTLPLSVQAVFACIRYTESRNHPKSVNVTSGAQGLYQFLPYLWTYGATALGIKAPTAMVATPQEQSAVAVWFYNRNNGFYPEWTDGCN